MRFRLFYLLLIFAAILSQNLNAQDVVVKRSTIIENYKGKPFYMHFVKPGESVAAIAKAYNITVNDLIANNPSIEKGLKTDMVLRIPQTAMLEVPDVVVEKKESITPQQKPAEPARVQDKNQDNPDYFIYQVKKQETLYGISRQNNLTVDDLLKANPGLDTLKEGMEIHIPKKKLTDKMPVNDSKPATAPQAVTPPNEILVKSGETLYSIAKMYNTTVDNLIDLNPQLNDGGLKAGMMLKLRATEGQSAAKKEAAVVVPVLSKPLAPANCYNAANSNNTYKIALLLPFLLNNSDNALQAPEVNKASDYENFDYMQFYAGFMMAADSLQKLGLHARIQVIDADNLNDTLTIRQALRKPGMDKMDLIVGPMYANSFTVAARFARKHEIGIVNPLSRRENIVNGNPYVFKAQVSGSAIASKITNYICNHYPTANVIAVRNDNKEYKPVADEFESQLKGRLASHVFKGSLQNANFSTEQIAGVNRKIKPNVKNIVVFFSSNKSSVPNFVSLLNPRSKSDDIILMGMEGWEDFDLETEFLVNLNYHQVTSTYVDYESEAVKQFIAGFKDKYGAVPLTYKHAFLGFDIGWYFLTNLMWYGDKYMQCIGGIPSRGLEYNFNFMATDKGNGFQNQDITIVKLQDYKLVKVE